MDEIRTILRMPKPAFDNLLQLLRPHITKQSNQGRTLGAKERLVATLRYLTLGDSPKSLELQFRADRNTMSRAIKETCAAICIVLKDYIRTPKTTAEWRAVARGFNERWNLPHCLGALDGKHCRILKPSKSGSLYYNYKKFFSLVLLAVCNSNYEIIWTSIGAEGKSSDSGIWKRSPIYQALHNRRNPLEIPAPERLQRDGPRLPYFFVGDDAFPLSSFMMKPYSRCDLTPRQRIFNYRLSRARMTIENVFGIMSAKFNILHKGINMEPENATTVISAVCHLHNYLRRHGGENYIGVVAGPPEQRHLIAPCDWRHHSANMTDQQAARHRNHSAYAKDVRNKLADYCVNDGDVAWQYDQVFGVGRN